MTFFIYAIEVTCEPSTPSAQIFTDIRSVHTKSAINRMKFLLPQLVLWASISLASGFVPLHTAARKANICLEASKEAPQPPPACSVGTLVEFSEKKRHHLGKITQVEHKTNGGTRYQVEEYPSGKSYSIADKEVWFTIPPRTNPKQEEQMLEQLEKAFVLTGNDLCNELDISPSLLSMAWEEASASETDLTPNALVELVHSHNADPVERYEAWRLLRSEIGHVFFKELKERGRVVSFKAKPAKAVGASKDQYCDSDSDNELCSLEGLLP